MCKQTTSTSSSDTSAGISPARRTGPKSWHDANAAASQTFDPACSRLSESALRAFMEKPVTGDLTEIPGVGSKTAACLQAKDIDTTFQLFGKYLLLRDNHISQQEHLDRFLRYLSVDAECPKAYVQSQVQAISEKMNTGFECRCAVQEELVVKSTSQMGEDKMAAFLAADLTGDLKKDLFGVGPKSVEKMAALGVVNTWQLVGKFLSTLRVTESGDGDKPANNADEFIKWLTAAGTAASYRATVVVQIVEKLKCGLWLPGDHDTPDGFQIQMAELSM